MINKLAKLGDAIAISKSETMNHSLTGVGAIASKKYNRHIYVSSFQNKCLFEVFFLENTLINKRATPSGIRSL